MKIDELNNFIKVLFVLRLVQIIVPSGVMLISMKLVAGTVILPADVSWEILLLKRTVEFSLYVFLLRCTSKNNEIIMTNKIVYAILLLVLYYCIILVTIFLNNDLSVLNCLNIAFFISVLIHILFRIIRKKSKSEY